jgi:hypothetical protein
MQGLQTMLKTKTHFLGSQKRYSLLARQMFAISTVQQS